MRGNSWICMCPITTCLVLRNVNRNVQTQCKDRTKFCGYPLFNTFDIFWRKGSWKTNYTTCQRSSPRSVGHFVGLYWLRGWRCLPKQLPPRNLVFRVFALCSVTMLYACNGNVSQGSKPCANWLYVCNSVSCHHNVELTHRHFQQFSTSQQLAAWWLLATSSTANCGFAPSWLACKI